MTQKSTSFSAGFSAIELLVTLFVASALVLAFYQLFTVIDAGNVHARNTAIASDLASSNLSKYPSKPSGMQNCGSVPSGGYIPTPDVTATGTQGLPGSVTQKIRATYPKACGQNDDVIKIESSVEYGPSPQKKVVQATYVN